MFRSLIPDFVGKYIAGSAGLASGVASSAQIQLRVVSYNVLSDSLAGADHYVACLPQVTMATVSVAVIECVQSTACRFCSVTGDARAPCPFLNLRAIATTLATLAIVLTITGILI